MESPASLPSPVHFNSGRTSPTSNRSSAHVRKLQAELLELRQRDLDKSGLKQQLQRAQQQNEQLREQLRHEQAEHQKLQKKADRDHLSHDLQRARDENELLKRQLAEHQGIVQRMNEQNMALYTQLKKEAHRATKLQEANTQLQAARAAMEQQLQHAQAAMQQMEGGFDSSLLRFKKMMDVNLAKLMSKTKRDDEAQPQPASAAVDAAGGSEFIREMYDGLARAYTLLAQQRDSLQQENATLRSDMGAAVAGMVPTTPGGPGASAVGAGGYDGAPATTPLRVTMSASVPGAAPGSAPRMPGAASAAYATTPTRGAGVAVQPHVQQYPVQVPTPGGIPPPPNVANSALREQYMAEVARMLHGQHFDQHLRLSQDPQQDTITTTTVRFVDPAAAAAAAARCGCVVV